MNRDEVKQVLVAIQATYPNYNPQDKGMAVDIWQRVIGGYDYDTIMAALEAYITNDVSGFAPSPGQVLNELRKVKRATGLSPMEAWALVYKAIQNSGWETKKQFDKLPRDIQRAVGSASQLHSWATDEHFNEGVVMSHFLKSYEEIVRRREEQENLPESAWRLLAEREEDV